ncbi:hypothetical protein A3K63_01700 [Candidatus Micrarchaeota archaeon RBG_16_49_10]|nr:MAG: hypothetical protein A3K63_01700 [Candidatus Micrarchaeota archaeon RBG_16_49_10]
MIGISGNWLNVHNIGNYDGLYGLVKKFYKEDFSRLEATRRDFQQIGDALTSYLVGSGILDGATEIYAAPVLRAGAGVLRPSSVRLLEEKANSLGVPFRTFGLGASRPHEKTDSRPARIYLNTLGDLRPGNDAKVILYEMGEATGATVVGASQDLRNLDIRPENLILLAGATCINQTEGRLGTEVPGMTIISGSQWLYNEKPGDTQFYLTRMYNPKTGAYDIMDPQDWGAGVSGNNMEEFLSLVEEVVRLTPLNRKLLRNEWRDKFN